MSVRNYGAAILAKHCVSEEAKIMLQKLMAAEMQTAKLIKLFHEERYVAVEILLEEISSQQVPEVDLTLVVATLSGYLIGESYESQLEVDVYGPGYSSFDAKAETAQASLVALVTMISQKNVFSMPNRVTEQQPKKVKKASTKKKKAVAIDEDHFDEPQI